MVGAVCVVVNGVVDLRSDCLLVFSLTGRHGARRAG